VASDESDLRSRDEACRVTRDSYKVLSFPRLSIVFAGFWVDFHVGNGQWWPAQLKRF
jgi:hypothetical protein